MAGRDERFNARRWDTSDRGSRLPPNWQALRQYVLHRDGYRCTEVTDAGRCPEQATDVDHVRAGDDHDLDNLQSLCRAHHKIKSSREGHAARWGAPPAKARRPPESHPGLR